MNSWTMTVPLSAWTNTLVFQAWDIYGNQLTNFNQTITVDYTGAIASQDGAIVFNKILHHPQMPGAEFVEFYNRATNAFNLSGWRVNGLDYTFPPGSFIQAKGYLVLAKDWLDTPRVSASPIRHLDYSMEISIPMARRSHCSVREFCPAKKSWWIACATKRPRLGRTQPMAPHYSCWIPRRTTAI